MSDLQQQLDETLESVKQNVPAEMFDVMTGETDQLKASGIESKTIQNEEKAPDFTLKNHLEKSMILSEMLGKGPVVLSFYRGGW